MTEGQAEKPLPGSVSRRISGVGRGGDFNMEDPRKGLMCVWIAWAGHRQKLLFEVCGTGSE